MWAGAGVKPPTAISHLTTKNHSVRQKYGYKIALSIHGVNRVVLVIAWGYNRYGIDRCGV